MLPHQRFGNRIVTWLVWLFHDVRVDDVPPMRVIRADVLALARAAGGDLRLADRDAGRHRPRRACRSRRSTSSPAAAAPASPRSPDASARPSPPASA